MGGGGSTTSTVNQSNLPAYAKPYYESLMKRGQTESQQAYQPYKGQRIAAQSAPTTAGMGQMSQYAASGTPMLNQATGIAGQVANQSLNAAGQTINAQTVGTQNFGQGALDQYMSPYMNNVVEGAQANAARNAQIEQSQRNLQAARAGSFGGSRSAVQNQMAAGQLQRNMSDIYTQGMQSAFENAQSQFNADQGRSLTAQQANQQANLDAQKSTAQYGIQNRTLAGQTASQLADYQGQMDQSALNRAKANLGLGQLQEDYTQKRLDQSYQDFVNQRDSEKQNLQFLSSLLQGVPVSANSDVTTTGSQNNLQGLLGSAGGLQALLALGKT
jgi:hypothetical protein